MPSEMDVEIIKRCILTPTAKMWVQPRHLATNIQVRDWIEMFCQTLAHLGPTEAEAAAAFTYVAQRHERPTWPVPAQFCVAILAARAERIRERPDTWENRPTRLALPGYTRGKRHPSDDDVMAEARLVFATPAGQRCLQEGLGNCLLELIADGEVTIGAGISPMAHDRMRSIHRKFLAALVEVDAAGDAWGGWGRATKRLGVMIADRASDLRDEHYGRAA